MNILLLMPMLDDEETTYIREQSDHTLNVYNDIDDTLTIECIDFTLTMSHNEFDVIYVYLPAIKNIVTDDLVIEKIGKKYFDVLPAKFTILITDHYSTEISNTTLPIIMVTRSLFTNPAIMLAAFENFPVVSKHDSHLHRSFIFSHNSIPLFIATADEIDHHTKSRIPVLAMSSDVESNFDTNLFFNSDYISDEQLKELGDTFWQKQYYNIWSSFYDQAD